MRRKEILLVKNAIKINLTFEKINELKYVDDKLLRKILETGKCTQIVMLYLEQESSERMLVACQRRLGEL